MMRKARDVGAFLWMAMLATALLLAAVPQAAASDWDIGARLGYDSNVNRSLDDAKADTAFTAYGSYERLASGESRVDWTFRATLSGSVYASESDLNQLSGFVAPGISVFLSPVWSLNAAPFLRGKAVSDSDQSALACGLRASLSQRWNTRIYSAQYYVYTNSSANEEVYSYTENAVGILAGVNWTPAFFTEIGYEYAHGDSFVTSVSQITAASMPARGRGYRYGYSPAFDALVVKDTVDRHSFSINIGYEITKAVFAVSGYTFTAESGDLGSLESHAAFLGLGYRF
ncbi:MAG: hypothetical protein A4E73_01915 [Syntrophaceae bacterium PtaU1.Bin231]|nr:MAG: hypothetical protein A4E73_01915 [Syntrophaceae bacterium PtaU1.Bin231]